MNTISNNIEKNPRPNFVGSPNIDPQSSEIKRNYSYKINRSHVCCEHKDLVRGPTNPIGHSTYKTKMVSQPP